MRTLPCEVTVAELTVDSMSSYLQVSCPCAELLLLTYTEFSTKTSGNLVTDKDGISYQLGESKCYEKWLARWGEKYSWISLHSVQMLAVSVV